MSVIFRKMNEKEITEIYETRMTKDFPPMELKPLHNIIDMMEQGIYESLLVYDQEPVGYALVLLPKGISYGLLDYLGTFSEKRNQGYGGQILKELITYYQDRKLMIESEYPDDAPDRRMAARRLQFYQRNGAVDTGVESRIFGAHYINLILSGQQENMNFVIPMAVPLVLPSAVPSAEEVKDILIQLYTGMLPDEEKRRKYLDFWIKNS